MANAEFQSPFASVIRVILLPKSGSITVCNFAGLANGLKLINAVPCWVRPLEGSALTTGGTLGVEADVAGVEAGGVGKVGEVGEDAAGTGIDATVAGEEGAPTPADPGVGTAAIDAVELPAAPPPHAESEARAGSASMDF